MKPTLRTRLSQYVELVPRRWLVAAAGLVLGLFVARVAYELWPGQLAALVFWPAGPALAIGIAALAAALYRWRGAGIGLRVFFPWALLLIYVLWPSVNLLQALVLFLGATALSLMILARLSGAQDWHMRWGARLVLAAATLALYLPTMGRTVGKADTFEFQVTAPVLGVAHPTGYPLFLLLAKAFSLLPFGSVAWRVNLSSVACAVAAVVLVYSVLGKVLARSDDDDSGRVCGFAASLSLAASPVFWSQAIVAEVYALNAAFVALLVWLVLYGLERRQHEPDWNARGWLFTLALAYGVSLTNHLTMAVWLPVLALAVWWVKPRATWSDWLKTAGLFGLGLSVYAYILVRWPALHAGQLMPFAQFVDWITGRQFGGALQFELWRDPTRWRILGRLLLEAYGSIGAGLALLGAAGLLFRRWRVALLTGLAFVAYCAYALVYNVPDISVFLIPAHLVMAVWMGVGIDQACPRSEAKGVTGFRFQVSGVPSKRSEKSCEPALEAKRGGLRAAGEALKSRLAPVISRVQSLLARVRSAVPWPRPGPQSVILNLKSQVLPLLFVLLPLSLIWMNLPQVDQSQAGRALVAWGRYVLALPLPRQATILADSEKIAPLYYLKRIEGVRRDLDILVMGSEELYRAELDQRIAQGKPVYLARFLPGLAGVYRLHSVGPLVRVSTTPQTSLPLIPITRQLDTSFGNGQLKLLGYDLTPGEGAVAYRLTCYWQAMQAIPANYHVRLRLVSEMGVVWWEDPGTHPVGGYNPTAAWWPGEIVPDYHEIPADVSFPPLHEAGGRYRLEVGLFVPFSDEGLRLDTSAGDVWYNIAWVDLNQPAGQAGVRTVLRANFGGQVLLRGASQPGVVPPDGRGEVVLEWERLAPGGDDSQRLPVDYAPLACAPLAYAQLTLARADGVPVRVLQVKPYAGEYPVSSWEVGRRLPMQIRFVAPDQPGQYTLRVGWVDESGQWVPARCSWMGRVAYECPLATLRVEGARREAGINFADQVVLVQSQIDRETLRPGETLDVTLRWQGLKGWPADYTAFVHLVGPDGVLHGQVDAYPVQGTWPTTQWAAGQIVDDPYVVTLAPDAPPGEYQVQVGWYLLATLRRLSVLDSAGRPVDDHVIVGTLTVEP